MNLYIKEYFSLVFIKSEIGMSWFLSLPIIQGKWIQNGLWRDFEFSIIYFISSSFTIKPAFYNPQKEFHRAIIFSAQSRVFTNEVKSHHGCFYPTPTKWKADNGLVNSGCDKNSSDQRPYLSLFKWLLTGSHSTKKQTEVLEILASLGYIRTTSEESSTWPIMNIQQPNF